MKSCPSCGGKGPTSDKGWCHDCLGTGKKQGGSGEVEDEKKRDWEDFKITCCGHQMILGFGGVLSHNTPFQADCNRCGKSIFINDDKGAAMLDERKQKPSVAEFHPWCGASDSIFEDCVKCSCNGCSHKIREEKPCLINEFIGITADMLPNFDHDKVDVKPKEKPSVSDLLKGAEDEMKRVERIHHKLLDAKEEKPSEADDIGKLPWKTIGEMVEFWRTAKANAFSGHPKDPDKCASAAISHGISVDAQEVVGRNYISISDIVSRIRELEDELLGLHELLETNEIFERIWSKRYKIDVLLEVLGLEPIKNWNIVTHEMLKRGLLDKPLSEESEKK